MKENYPKDFKSNSFIDLNGIPYLLAEYFDNNVIQQIDRSYIRSDIFVDQSEAMKAVVDINIDDIGRRSNQKPAVLGNLTKQKKLEKMIMDMAARYDFNHQLNVLRRGIIVRINYQVEEHGTKRVIRTSNEDFIIHDRMFFLDVNGDNINDNAIIVNFNQSIPSTITEFTSGRGRMVFRITNIQLYYECLKDGPKGPHVKHHVNALTPTEVPYNPNNMYDYHNQLQSRQIINSPDSFKESEIITPPSWSLLNRYYHVDNGGKDFILHFQEINDPACPSGFIPCGNIVVNKSFAINPGHRLVFKISIWKNDLTVIGDTSRVASLLGSQIHNVEHNHKHPNHCNDHNDKNEVIYLRKQIKRLTDFIEELQGIIKQLVYDKNNTDNNDQTTGSIPMTPLFPATPIIPDNTGNNCECDHTEMDEKIKELEAQIEALKNQNNECDHSDIDDKLAEITASMEQLREDIRNADADIILGDGDTKVDYVEADDVEDMFNQIKNGN